MLNLLDILSKEERTALTLCALYAEYGYQPYRMSKFEEYDLYVKNKDFLVSENVITFTDTDGRLLALKPDVTLSIIKNSRDTGDALNKVYYNERVYRVSKGTRSFKEIMQAGLECFGDVSESTVVETLYLAGKSLDVISESNVLEISHLDVVAGVLEEVGANSDVSREILRLLGEKNAQGIADLCERENIGKEAQALLEKLVSVYGAPKKVLPLLDGFAVNERAKFGVEQLKTILVGLSKQGVEEKIRIDFSVVNDMSYYNGISFKGFVEGVPVGVLSGGQYDGLMKKIGKRSKAIGFAVYLDEIFKRGNGYEENA
jgi:ATP phosphoribosyltransferase regulatory subunit